MYYVIAAKSGSYIYNIHTKMYVHEKTARKVLQKNIDKGVWDSDYDVYGMKHFNLIDLDEK